MPLMKFEELKKRQKRNIRKCKHGNSRSESDKVIGKL